MLRPGIAAAVPWALLLGCATGSVRQVHVGPLQHEGLTAGVRIEAVTHTGLEGAAFQGASRALAAGPLAQAPNDAPQSLRLQLSVLEAQSPQVTLTSTDRLMSFGRSVVGLAGVGASGARAGHLELEARLLPPAPDTRTIGYARWAREGDPAALADTAGDEVTRAMMRLVPTRQKERTERRAADERLLLTPTAQTLEPGEVVFSDDEVVLVRLGVGLTRRLQIDLFAGGFPIPAAAGGAAASHAIIAGGAGGALVLGFWDLGLKLRVLDESATWPGLAIGYDLLDLFGLGAGGVGVVFLGDGAGGGGFGAVGGANAQFNLFSLVAAKHFGPAQLTLGTYILDNHHFLPQTAGFQAICAGAVAGPGGAAAGGADCGSGSARLPRLPVHVQPFTGTELVLGAHSSLMAELFWARPLEDSMLTTGARWLLGGKRDLGPLALDRIRFRIDAAVLWFYEPAHGGNTPRGAHALWLPWLGVGAYFL